MDATAARTALTVITTHWDDLADALAARPVADWPPSMGISRMREPDETGDGRPGDVRTLPIVPEVLDAMREITDDLTALADHISTQVQRPPVYASTRQGWADDVHRAAALLAARDAADPRRWHIDTATTAPAAAAWLHARLTHAPGDGPFRPLHLAHVRQITDTAVPAAARIEQLLHIARRRTSTGRQHDGCGGTLHVSGGDGGDPEVQCDRCARTWRPATAA